MLNVVPTYFPNLPNLKGKYHEKICAFLSIGAVIGSRKEIKIFFKTLRVLKVFTNDLI